MEEEALHFSSRIDKFDSNLWGFHFAVPAPIANALTDGADRRVVCTLNDKLTFQCAIMPKGDGEWFINVNKSNRTKLGLNVGSPVEVSLRKDHSEYGLPMPEELQEVLQQDETASQRFEALTPGKKRTLLYYCSQPKTSDLRIHRALAIAEHLKKNEGKINFRQLMQEFRMP